MADEKINIIVSLKDNASKAITGLKDGFDKLGIVAKAVTAAGIATLSKVLYDCVKAFGQSETATKGLESALRSTGQEVKGNLKQLTDFANKMQKLTTIEDDAVISLLKTGVAMGMTADESERAAQQAIGLSAAYGVDLESAFRMAAAAGEGNFTMMQRAIPTLRGMTDKTLIAAEANRLMAAGFQQAQDQTKTFEGSMLQLKNSVNSAQETIGSVFAPVISKIAGVIKDIVDRFNELDPTMQKNIVIIGSITAAVIALIPVLGVLAGLIAGISWPVLAVVAGVAALTAGFLILKNEITAVGGVTNFLKNNFITAFQIMINVLEHFLQQFQKLLDVINKMSGGKLDLNVDSALEGLDKLDQRLEEHKVKRQEDNTQELEETKQHEQNKMGIKAGYQALSDEQVLLKKEIEAQQRLEDLDAYNLFEDAKLQKKLLNDEVLNKAELDRLKKLNEMRKQGSAEYVSFLAQASKEETDLGRATAMGVLGWAKEGLQKQVQAKAAELVAQGTALLPTLLVGDPSSLLYITAGTALAVAGTQAINSIQLAEGGIVMPQPGGVSATIAEAGSPEAVIPLDSPQAQGMMGGNQNISVNISGKPLAKEMYEIQQEMIRTGELSA